MQRENVTMKLATGQAAHVTEIRSGDTPTGSYNGGLWHGYELSLQNSRGQVLDTARIETVGYPVSASLDISPDGNALAVIAQGNDGFEQEDHTIGVYEISSAGKLKTLYREQREGGRIVTEYPRLSWIEDAQIKVEWITTGTSSPVKPESITISRTQPDPV